MSMASPAQGIDWTRVRQTCGRFSLPVVAIALVLVAGLVSPTFLQPQNLRNMAIQAVPLGLVVLGQTFVILVRGLDLSVASMMATAAVIATSFASTSDAMILPIFLTVIAFSAGVGAVNGWLVVSRGVSPFLATLATMIILQGLRFTYTGGTPASTLPPGMAYLSRGVILGVPFNLVVLIVLTLVLGALLNSSAFGRRVMMVGGNPEAARLVGINPQVVTLLCYVICSVMAGLGGLFLLSYIGVVSNFLGQGYEIDSIVAAAVGGIALTGGRGTLTGALFGVAILVVISNLVVLLGMPLESQIIVKGLIVLGAAAFYRS
ncbi:MAG TPA: ABC transporter permease, partial [Bauldia sp.]|nr:ABC transporter permease [Bauldia sp.]